MTSLDPQLEQQVLAKLTQLQVNREAQQRYEASFLEQVTLPEGVLIDDPPPADPPELIDGILLTFGATGIIGEKEVGKSLVALEIQHSLLTGEPLWGQLYPNKILNKTVHFLAEHASRGLMDLYARTGMSKTGKLRVFGPEHLQAMKLLVSGGQRREEAVSFYKKLAEGAGLVVFDPLAAFIQGESAENDNSPMRSLIDTMIEIGSSTGAACLVLGHQGKPQMYQGREMKRASYATRGASAIEDAMAAVHYLDKQPNSNYNGHTLFKFRPIHYKGFRKPAFVLMRDLKTCRHSLDPKAKSKFALTDSEDED